MGVVSIAELREIRNKTIQGKKNDAIIISNDELQRIRGTVVVKSPEQLMEDKRKADTLKETMGAAARTRKEKM